LIQKGRTIAEPTTDTETAAMLLTLEEIEGRFLEKVNPEDVGFDHPIQESLKIIQICSRLVPRYIPNHKALGIVLASQVQNG
jgi:hypothetical protein